MSTDHHNGRWRKSTRSDSSTACVELHGDLQAVRDSKNPAGPTLAGGTTAMITALLGWAQAC